MRFFQWTRKAVVGAAAILAACSEPSDTTGQTAGQGDTATAASAEILWDKWGVPHIHSDDNEAAMYALGWAQMRSHGNLILRHFAEARGRAAEYWGKDHIQSDLLMRRMSVPQIADRWIDEQRPQFRAFLESFVDGMNDFAEANPDLIDDTVRPVLPVSPSDPLAHLLRSVHMTFVAGRDLQRIQGIAEQAAAAAASSESAGSNSYAIAPERSASGNAMLLINPHLPWTGIYKFVEFQVTTDDVDVYGVTLTGLPIVTIGFTKTLGWTHTVNLFDGADTYELTLAEGGYRFDGSVRPFETESDTLLVRQPDGSLAEHAYEIRSSVHGPVIAEVGDKAYALKMIGADAPHVLEQYWDMINAGGLDEFEAAASRLQMPMFHFVYADKHGDIYFLFNGRQPDRGDIGTWQDWRGILPGDDPAYVWEGTLGYEALPHYRNPESGFIQNANDAPWTSTFPRAVRVEDYSPLIAPQRMPLRPQRSAAMMIEDTEITFEELLEMKLDTHVELADRTIDQLISHARRQDDQVLSEAANVLEKWNRRTDPESAGAVLFLEWADRFLSGGEASFAESWDPLRPLETPSGLADPDGAIAQLRAASEYVRSSYGDLAVRFGDVYRLRWGDADLPAGQANGQYGIFRVGWYQPAEDGTKNLIGGDSFVAAVEFGDPLRAVAHMGYGNSSEPDSPHYDDQVKLLSDGAFREVLFTRAAQESALERRELLQP